MRFREDKAELELARSVVAQWREHDPVRTERLTGKGQPNAE